MASRIIVVILLIISLVVTGSVILHRTNHEMSATSVHFIVDFQDLEQLNHNYDGVLDAELFLQSGVKDVVIRETTIKKLQEDGVEMSIGFAKEITADYQTLMAYSNNSIKSIMAFQPADGDFILLTKDKVLLDKIKVGISQRYSYKSYYFVEEGIILHSEQFHNLEPTRFELNSINNRKPIDNYLNRVYSIILETPLFYDQDQIKRATESGFHPILAMSSFDLSLQYLSAYEKATALAYNSDTSSAMVTNEILIEGRLLGKAISEASSERIKEYLINTSRSLGIITTEQVNQPVSRYELALFREFDNVVPYVISPLLSYDEDNKTQGIHSLVDKVKYNHIRGIYFRIPDAWMDEYSSENVHLTMGMLNDEFAKSGYEVSTKIAPIKHDTLDALEVLAISCGVVVFLYMFIIILFSIKSEIKTLLLLGLLVLNVIGFVVFGLDYRYGLINLLLILLPSIGMLFLAEYSRQEIEKRTCRRIYAILGTTLAGFALITLLLVIMGLYITALSSSKDNLLYSTGVQLNTMHILFILLNYLVVYLRTFGYKRKNEELVEGTTYFSDLTRILKHNVTVYQVIGAVLIFVVIRLYILTTLSQVKMFVVGESLVALGLAAFNWVWIVIGISASFLHIYLVNRQVSELRFPLLFLVNSMFTTFIVQFSSNQPVHVLAGSVISSLLIILPVGIVTVVLAGIGMRLVYRFNL